MELFMEKRFFAGGYLYDPETQKILLHHRDNNTTINPNKWAFFGGTDENNETPKECFIREIREELDVTVSPEEVRLLRDYFNVERDTHRYVFYVSRKEKETMIHLNEGQGYAWVTLDEAANLDMTEKTHADLEYFRNLKV